MLLCALATVQDKNHKQQVDAGLMNSIHRMQNAVQKWVSGAWELTHSLLLIEQCDFLHVQQLGTIRKRTEDAILVPYLSFWWWIMFPSMPGSSHTLEELLCIYQEFSIFWLTTLSQSKKGHFNSKNIQQ